MMVGFTDYEDRRNQCNRWTCCEDVIGTAGRSRVGEKRSTDSIDFTESGPGGALLVAAACVWSPFLPLVGWALQARVTAVTPLSGTFLYLLDRGERLDFNRRVP